LRRLLFSLPYYLQPFLEEGNPIFQFFLPQEYAISIPATLLVIALTVVGIFIGYTLSKAANSRKKK
jgi:hypothetical protein